MRQAPTDEQVKEASLAAAGAMAAGGHLLANLAFKGFRTAGRFARANPGRVGLLRRIPQAIGRRFNTAQSNQIARGIANARAGRPQGFWSRAADTWVAPEFQGGTHLGRTIGTNLRGMSTPQATRRLNQLTRQLGKNPEFTRNAPWMANLQQGMTQAVSKGLPEVGTVQKASRLSRIGSNIVGAPVAAVDPGILGHVAMNKGRMALSRSAIGRAMTKRQAVTGVGRATGAPGTTSRLARTQNALTDFFVSPAVRDPSRLTEQFARLAQNNPRRARGLATALSNVTSPSTQSASSRLLGLGDRLQVPGAVANLTQQNRRVLAQISAQYSRHANPTVRQYAAQLRAQIPVGGLNRGTAAAATVARSVTPHANRAGRWLIPTSGLGYGGYGGFRGAQSNRVPTRTPGT